jgi:hypothetical protein
MTARETEGCRGKNTGKRRADGCAAQLQKTEQRGCQPGLPSKWMERDRSTERID